MVDTMAQAQKLLVMSAEQELMEMRKRSEAQRELDARMAQGVPRVIRRQMYKVRDPNTRRARKELSRMKQAAARHGINL